MFACATRQRRRSLRQQHGRSSRGSAGAARSTPQGPKELESLPATDERMAAKALLDDALSSDDSVGGFGDGDDFDDEGPAFDGDGGGDGFLPGPDADEPSNAGVESALAGASADDETTYEGLVRAHISQWFEVRGRMAPQVAQARIHGPDEPLVNTPRVWQV